MAKQQDNVFELIRTVEQFSNEMIVRWTRSFPQNLGISPILVLHQLDEHGALKQTELANMLGYTPGAMTNIANRLLKEGFASRERDEQDRRIVRLALTPDGKDFLKKAHEKGAQLRQEVFEKLDKNELDEYLRIQKKLVGILEELE
ncbi:MarR family transcriptional regulator [Aciduricibacillus chroicocephali]|uniref:MarR family transcriptional regulator n=1 Tax=Aciduricibacillus chroicocephali TaxID=3054939 RepID=A0ABY9KSA6_9BACI|nr:MarR family transcriptional regulator [Bacillaceae bacterium 44XB]